VIVRWDDVQPGQDIGGAANALNDVCYYPRSNKIYWRGASLTTRLEPLGYDDGEPEE
jgi:hypothetical protein